MFESAEIRVPCPGCGHKSVKSLAWLKANDQFICDGCGKSVTLDREQFRAGLDKVDQSIAKFRASLRNFGKKR